MGESKSLVKSIFNEMFASNIKSNNWPKVVFKDIFKKESYKVNIPSNENGIYWLLNLDAIEPNSGNVIFKKYVRDSEIGVSTFKFEPNCILYSKLRPYLNKVIISDDYGFATSELIPLKCNNKQLNIIYAVNLLRSSKFVSYIQEHVAGVKMPRVQMDKFWNYQICLPPVEYQSRFAKITIQRDKLKLIAQQISKKISIIQKTVFNDFFDGDNFQIKKISECTDTVSGGTPSTSHKEYYENGNIPWITSTEVSQGYINHALKHITKEGLKNSSAKLVPENTVVVAMYCKGTAGKAGLLKIQAATNQALCCILPCNLFNPIYLYHALNNSEHILQSQLKGGVQKNLSQELIRNLEIKVPPILLQNKFADIIKRLDKLKANIEQILKILE